jgi:hypothetical protein
LALIISLLTGLQYTSNSFNLKNEESE